MNPTDQLISNAQTQAEQGFQNNFPSITSAVASPGSTTDQAAQALQQPSAPAQTAPAANQPSILERLLPTIGSVGGGLLAGGLDLVTGGAAIPFDAAIAGAGGALGKTAENALTHQALGNGVMGAAAGGALGQAGGAIGGALLGKAGSLVQGLGDKMAVNNAGKVAQATVDAQTQADAKAAENTAANYKNNYGSISDRVQRDLKLGTNGKFVDSMGGDGSNPYHMQQVSQGGHELNSVYNDALEKSPDVNMADFGNQVYKTMQQTGTTDLSTTPLGKALQDFGVAPNEPLPESMPATQVRQLQQAVGKQIGNTQKLINNSELQGVANTEAESHLKTLQDVYSNLGSKIKTPQVDQAVANTTIDDNARAALQEKYGVQHGNYIADTINNGKSADDLLKPMQSYTQMGRASDMAINDIENAPGTARALARTKADVAPAETPQAGKGNLLTADNAVKLGSLFEGTAGGHPLALAAPLIMKAAENPAVVSGLGKGISAVGNSAVPGIVGGVMGNAGNDTAGPAGANTAINAGDVVNPQSNIYRDAIIADLYNAGNGGLSNLNGAIDANRKVAAAQSAEQNLGQIYNQAGGGQGLIGGLLNELGGKLTGGEAGSYNGQAAADQQVIAQALGVPAGSIQTPQLTQNQSGAQASLGNIQSLIQALTQGQGVQPGLIGSVR